MAYHEYYHYFGINGADFNDEPKKPRKGFRNHRGTVHPIDKKTEKTIQRKGEA